MLSRRLFLGNSVAFVVGSSWAQAPSAPTTRPNLAEIDHVRILAAAARALAKPAVPNRDITSDAWLQFTVNLPALAAAAIVDPARSEEYRASASAQLEAWLLDPKNRPELELESYEPLIDLSALAELVVGIPFLGLEPALVTRLEHSFAALLTFLTTDRTALLARDAKNHHASSWLLLVTAFARFTRNDAVLAEARHRFKTQTLRAQVDAKGFFPHELTEKNPFRESLFNLDLLAGACVLLTTRFESVWDYELQDGPGMRAAIARFAPYIRDRVTWPYPSDEERFKQLPGRRPALVFAGRAYSQADYVTLWSTLDADPKDPMILRTFPIRQPILWLPQTHAASSPAGAS